MILLSCDMLMLLLMRHDFSPKLQSGFGTWEDEVMK